MVAFFCPPPFVRPAYNTEVLKDSPTRYYRMGESAGTTATDAMGVANGTYVNTPTLAQTGLVRGRDTSVLFNGTDEQVTATAPTLSFPLTVECWVKFAALGSGFPTILATNDQANRSGVRLAINSTGGNLHCEMADGAGSAAGNRRNWIVAGAISAGNTYHIAFVATSISSATVYINGVAQSPSTEGSGASIGSGGTQRFAGSTQASYGFANITLDEVAIYSSALSAARVAAHYRAGL
jgi:hypothetical protein